MQVLLQNPDMEESEQDEPPQSQPPIEFVADSDNSLTREVRRETNRRKAFKTARETPLQKRARERLDRALDDALRGKRWGTPESTLSEAVTKRRSNFLSESSPSDDEEADNQRSQYNASICALTIPEEESQGSSEAQRKRETRAKRPWKSGAKRTHRYQPRSQMGRFTAKKTK